MAERRWYTEPETFIAAAALVVSVSAVVVGLYEASLQRHHDRAEVWPRLEIETFTSKDGATIIVENTGIGPAIVRFVSVTVDGKPQRNWSDAMAAWLGKAAPRLSQQTIFDHGVRAGSKVQLVGLQHGDLPPNFWYQIKRIALTVCYASVFDEYWTVSTEQLGTKDVWRSLDRCPAQAEGAGFLTGASRPQDARPERSARNVRRSEGRGAHERRA